MSFKDAMVNLINKMRQGPVIANNQEPNMPNGGHTGYVPPVPPAQGQRQAPAQQMPPQNPAPQYTGFSGNGYDPNFYASTGFQQNYAGTSFQGGMPGAQPTGWQTSFQAAQRASQTGPQTAVPQYATPQYTAAQGSNPFAMPPQPAAPQPMAGMTGVQSGMTGMANIPREGNVLYPFGQQFRDEQGRTYNHCERLAQPLSVATCFRLIEFMRNGESIIVNLELVPDDRERSRCLDMLFGAAFTMNCTFNRVASRCLYLIAPSTVVVKPYESIREMTQQDMDQRWGAAEEERTPDRGSRRSSFGERRSEYGTF